MGGSSEKVKFKKCAVWNYKLVNKNAVTEINTP